MSSTDVDNGHWSHGESWSQPGDMELGAMLTVLTSGTGRRSDLCLYSACMGVYFFGEILPTPHLMHCFKNLKFPPKLAQKGTFSNKKCRQKISVYEVKYNKRQIMKKYRKILQSVP